MTVATTVSKATAVLTAAMSQLGVKYVFGGESPGKDFDCSGFTQWAYSTVGIVLPRTSQEQEKFTTPIPAGSAKPGDLNFSAGSDGTATSPGHVGIYVGNGKMIDAPHTGAVVRVENVPSPSTYGRVPGLQLDASGVAAQAAGNSASTTTSGNASVGSGCGAKGKIFGVATISFSYCQGKALVGGLLIGAGIGMALLGLIIIVAWGLGHTSGGRGMAAAAGKVPLARSVVRAAA